MVKQVWKEHYGLLMGIEHIEPQWPEVSILWCRLRLLVVGRIIRLPSRFLSREEHTLDKALLTSVGRICQYDGAFLSLISNFILNYILAN